MLRRNAVDRREFFKFNGLLLLPSVAAIWAIALQI
jgi:hypothetical protein